jgi:23S rRNA U2552 (ribose-2'-O)-methylase RlmE/FtsJ
MEIVILKNVENVELEIFKNQIPSVVVTFNELADLKSEDYGNFKDLDHTKCKIDTLDKFSEKHRRAAAKYLHEYELVKLLCKKQVISRAYFKLYEIVYHEPFILSPNLNCFFICEAPGGFIECVVDIRRKKNLQTKFYSISKLNDILYDNYLEKDNIVYGDITNVEIIDKTIKNVFSMYPDGMDFITADGGFDIKVFNGQEIISTKLILCEIYLALKTQKKGGTFVIKFFDMFTHNSIMYYMLLCTFYEYVKIIKPKTSRNCNSERYLVCYNYNGNGKGVIDELYVIISQFVLTENTLTLLYPNVVVDPNIIHKIKSFNNLVLYEQIKTINESIRMVHGKNIYFQNLLLKIFLETYDKTKSKHLENIYYYKNILGTRIKKCCDFLRYYNINTIEIK